MVRWVEVDHVSPSSFVYPPSHLFYLVFPGAPGGMPGGMMDEELYDQYEEGMYS